MEYLRSRGANVMLAVGLILLMLGLFWSAPRLTDYVASRRYPLPHATALPGTAMPTPTTTATVTPSPTPGPTQTLPPPTLTPAPSPSPSPPTLTPLPTGVEPMWLRIPAISLDAPVIPIGHIATDVEGATQSMWDVPDWRAVGWHNTSARIGIPGNSVFNGHNTAQGEVFRDLYKLEAGDLVLVGGADDQTYTYQVTEKLVLPEEGQPLAVRRENARYIQPTEDERLTLVTCHPYGSLANRLLVIAHPAPETDPYWTETKAQSEGGE